MRDFIKNLIVNIVIICIIKVSFAHRLLKKLHVTHFDRSEAMCPDKRRRFDNRRVRMKNCVREEGKTKGDKWARFLHKWFWRQGRSASIWTCVGKGGWKRLCAQRDERARNITNIQRVSHTHRSQYFCDSAIED